LVEFLYTRGIGGSVEQNLVLETESIMPSAPLPPEKQAEVDDLARAIREAVDAEINETVDAEIDELAERGRGSAWPARCRTMPRLRKLVVCGEA